MTQMLSDTDRELLERQFRIREPQKYPGLTPRVDRGVRAKQILYWYDETPPGGERAGHKRHVICAFGHPHWKGFVVELEDGRIVLVGNRCALKDFGYDIAEVIKSFGAQRDRQFELLRLIALREAWPSALVEIRALKFHPVTLGYDNYWKAMRTGLPEFHGSLRATVKSSAGLLLVEERVRDEDAEEEAARKDRRELFKAYEKATDPDRRKVLAAEIRKHIDSLPRQYKIVSRDFGRCLSWGLLLEASANTPKALVVEAIDIANRVTRMLDTWNMSKRDFAKLRGHLDQLFERLDRAASRVAGLSSFCSPPNLAAIARWASAKGLDIRAEGGALVSRTRLELPPKFFWPLTPKIDAMRAARDVSPEVGAQEAA